MKKVNFLVPMMLFWSLVSINIFAMQSAYFNEPVEMNASLVQKQKDSRISNLEDSLALYKGYLIDEVHSYITTKSPKSKMNAEFIIDCCVEYNFDIGLLLAQAQQESCFGLTKRPFGVMNRKYNDPNDAVIPYINLMQTSFLRTMTVEEALNTGLYVNGSRRYRYAGNPNYCKVIKNIKFKIENNTDILNLYNDYISIKTVLDSIKEKS